MSAIGLGCMELSHTSGAQIEKDEAIEIHLSNNEIVYIDGLLDQMDFLVFGGSSSK